MSNNEQTTGTASPDDFEAVDEGMLWLGLPEDHEVRRAHTFIGEPLGDSSPVFFDFAAGEVR